MAWDACDPPPVTPWIECSIGDAPSDYELVELDSGYLAHHIANDASVPFDPADWNGSPATLVNGHLQIGDGGFCDWAVYQALAPRSKMLMQARGLTAIGGASNDFLWLLLHAVAHVEGIVLDVGVNDNDLTDIARLRERTQDWCVGPDLTDKSYDNLGDKRNSRYYTVSMWVDGLNHAWYDHLIDFTDATILQSLNSGLAGLGGFFDPGGWERLYLMKDRVVTVEGLPAGYSAEVLDQNGVVIASQVESGGTAVISLWGEQFHEFGILNSDDGNPYPKTVQVKDIGGDVLASQTKDVALWGGGHYRFSIPAWIACDDPLSVIWSEA